MEEQLSREKLEVLVKLLEKIGKLKLPQILDFLVKEVVASLKIERCSIFKISTGLEKANLVAGEPPDGHGLGMSFNLDELKAIKEVVMTKEYLLISDPKNDERVATSRPLIYDKNINAILFIPLITRDEVIGVIVVDTVGEKKDFSQEEIYFCLNVSNLVSLLLERDMILGREAERETLAILGQAAAEAAHRIRHPLVIIGGFARRLVEKLRDSEYQYYVQTIADEVSKLESTLNKLLKFSRLNKTKVNLVESDINKILQEAEKFVMELVRDKNIKFNLQLDSELPQVFIDPLEIKNVFLDILRNAVEASRESGEIFVKTKLERNQIKISFANTGGCIEKEIIQEIFNPFFTTKPDGTGLGLAIAYATIRAYNGEIKVENDEELGITTFTVTIPIKRKNLSLNKT